MLSILSLLILPALAVGMVSTVRKKAWFALFLLLSLNPLAVFFAGGVVAYFQGAPTIRFMGLPDIESFNIDRSTRCFSSGGGCVMHGNEWVFLTPHNLAVRTMAQIFGPPSRSYDGPYPTQEEAMQLTANAPPIPISPFLEGNVNVNGKVVTLDKAMIKRIVDRLNYFYLSEDDIQDLNSRVRAVIYQKRCLILRLSANDPPGEMEGLNFDAMIFFDTNTKRPFAYFNLTRNYLPRYPPVSYLPESDR